MEHQGSRRKVMKFISLPQIIGFVGAATYLLGGAHLQAQPQVIPAGGNPRSASVTIDSSTDLSQPIYFYYVSPGNETRTVEVTLEGPNGATATVEIAKFRGSAQQAAAAMPRKFQMQMNRALRVSGPNTSYAYSPRMGSFPGGCTEAQYQLYLELINATPELSGVTPEQFCAGFGGEDPPPSGGDGGGTGQIGNEVTQIGLLRKNACAGARRSRYLVRMKVDLSAVDPASVQGGIQVRGAFRERNYTGSKAASIKPRSDGMFAPAPLLLMSSVYSYGSGERIVFSRWKNNKPKRAIPVRIENYVYYRGLALTRSVATSFLNGKGKATFEITNGERAYSVCFDMRRARQSRNGYPIGDDA